MIVKLNLREMFSKRRDILSGKKERAQVGGGQTVSEGAGLGEVSRILSGMAGKGDGGPVRLSPRRRRPLSCRCARQNRWWVFSLSQKSSAVRTQGQKMTVIEFIWCRDFGR